MRRSVVCLTGCFFTGGSFLCQIFYLSEGPVAKITTPHYKKLYRFFGNDTGKAIADYLTAYDEPPLFLSVLLQKPVLYVPQPLGQIHIVLVGVVEALSRGTRPSPSPRWRSRPSRWR